MPVITVHGFFCVIVPDSIEKITIRAPTSNSKGPRKNTHPAIYAQVECGETKIKDMRIAIGRTIVKATQWIVFILIAVKYRGSDIKATKMIIDNIYVNIFVVANENSKSLIFIFSDLRISSAEA